ncbi:ATP-NAD kinase family protein [Pseudomonas gingeri]|uniref:ATP-NAD kinase family protein n=1 Tax=Pseudomonas gingeri TaxID=117681 RepID=A0A7Y7YFY2_9PSED|nr:ATP-NAD kinase family protein [Pseudomonas gingeri]NWA02604.1 ATP-NAD kinase family protein [Pseudomonas gingeri]NWA12223.1 ATP-NAD kinase family protein [Pseudomonas gingeri]NWA57371.1 ATP-NAD kinase family protein [Pseudomonas gingeri]NWA93714.1 ATP-NAD kinase family protein [Pseudomonas gingeri]NWB03186.1 ATP-NAD kinase family protein [Pseudomonas gingeri]
MAFKIGLLINPFAGLGGTIGLKGSDGADTVALALKLGARPKAHERCVRTLRRLLDSDAQVMTVAGEMGERACHEAGLPARVIATPATEHSARDTVEACRALLAASVDLLLFAGGDGTARDVAAATAATPTLLLGIPCGVKMYSGVFARSPEHAGEVARQCARGSVGSREAELLDIDENASREDRVSTRLYGYARVPADPRHMQGAKSGSANPDRAVEAEATLFAARMHAEHVYFLGPGRTIQALARHLNGEPTLLGVDAYLGQTLICRDANESDLLTLATRYPAHVVVSLTGGQGCLFGRGNQQISAAVLALIAPTHLHVLASSAKIAALPQGQLFVDSGDPALDARLSGFIRVHTAPGRSAMVRVVH